MTFQYKSAPLSCAISQSVLEQPVSPSLVEWSSLTENLAWCQNSTVFLLVFLAVASSLIRNSFWSLSCPLSFLSQHGARFPAGPSVLTEFRTIARQLLSPTS